MSASVDDLTSLEAAGLAARVADLVDRGYVEVDECEGLQPGARIRHVYAQYTAAYAHGTGAVLVILQRPNPWWEGRFGHPDVELVVRRDKPLLPDGGRLSFVALHHIEAMPRWTW